MIQDVRGPKRWGGWRREEVGRAWGGGGGGGLFALVTSAVTPQPSGLTPHPSAHQPFTHLLA